MRIYNNMTCLIYKATNLLDGKAYVGWTSRRLSQRKVEHFASSGSTYFHNALRKHGKENFEWEVLFQCRNPEMAANVWEPHFIQEQQTHMSQNGYNMTFGGEGMTGWQCSPEECEKRSDRMTGENHYNWGKTLSKETRKRIGDTLRGRKRKPFNQEHRIRIGKANQGEKNTFSKLTSSQVAEILLLEKQGIKQKDIASVMNVTPATISRIVRGLIWKHVILENNHGFMFPVSL